MADATPTTYLREGDRLRCTLHGAVFARTEACAACVSDPGPPPDGREESPTVPTGCLSSVELEREFVAIAAELGAIVASLRQGKPRRSRKGDLVETVAPLDPHLCNTIAKLTDARLKALRAASEHARYREDEATVTRREREKRALDRGASH